MIAFIGMVSVFMIIIAFYLIELFFPFFFNFFDNNYINLYYWSIGLLIFTTFVTIKFFFILNKSLTELDCLSINIGKKEKRELFSLDVLFKSSCFKYINGLLHIDYLFLSL